MRLFSVLAAVAILAVTASSIPAAADSRVFIVANQPDGYGIDQCLSKGERCGAHAAKAYCQARDFSQATAYRRVDPDEVTGAVSKAGMDQCTRAGCGEFVAITCER